MALNQLGQNEAVKALLVKELHKRIQSLLQQLSSVGRTLMIA